MVLDEAQIEKLTVEDKEFIEEFKNLEMLSFNLTKINTLENFPKLPTLKRVSAFKAARQKRSVISHSLLLINYSSLRVWIG